MKVEKKYAILSVLGIIIILFAFSIYGQENTTSIPMLLRNILAEIRDLGTGLIERECTDFVNMGLPTPGIGSNQNQAFLFPPADFYYREYEILELTSVFVCNSNSNHVNLILLNLIF